MDLDKTLSLQDFRNLLHERSQGAQELASSSLGAEALEQPIIGYRMLEKMGSGGMCSVFKAEHIASGKIVALKLLYPGHNKTNFKRFLQEGMLLMRLEHPNVLIGFDFGVSNGIYYLAIEFVQGESLQSFLDKGLVFTEDFTFQIALQIAKAIAYLGTKGIVHRDVKPGNILLMVETAKLCDFGLALCARQDDLEGEMETTCGTVEYISPEQARGEIDLDGRSDIYSLGITCIHSITGRLPFSGDSPEEIMRCQIYERIPLESLPNISPSASMVLDLMIAKDRAKRIYPEKLIPLLEKFLVRQGLKN